MSREEYFSSKTTGASGTLGYDVKDLFGKMETGFTFGISTPFSSSHPGQTYMIFFSA